MDAPEVHFGPATAAERLLLSSAFFSNTARPKVLVIRRAGDRSRVGHSSSAGLTRGGPWSSRAAIRAALGMIGPGAKPVRPGASWPRSHSEARRGLAAHGRFAGRRAAICCTATATRPSLAVEARRGSLLELTSQRAHPGSLRRQAGLAEKNLVGRWNIGGGGGGGAPFGLRESTKGKSGSGWSAPRRRACPAISKQVRGIAKRPPPLVVRASCRFRDRTFSRGVGVLVNAAPGRRTRAIATGRSAGLRHPAPRLAGPRGWRDARQRAWGGARRGLAARPRGRPPLPCLGQGQWRPEEGVNCLYVKTPGRRPQGWAGGVVLHETPERLVESPRACEGEFGRTARKAQRIVPRQQNRAPGAGGGL